jgi:hypothetical protein
MKSAPSNPTEALPASSDASSTSKVDETAAIAKRRIAELDESVRAINARLHPGRKIKCAPRAHDALRQILELDEHADDFAEQVRALCVQGLAR